MQCNATENETKREVPCPDIEIVFLFSEPTISPKRQQVLILLKAFSHKKVGRPNTFYNIIDFNACSNLSGEGRNHSGRPIFDIHLIFVDSSKLVHSFGMFISENLFDSQQCFSISFLSLLRSVIKL